MTGISSDFRDLEAPITREMNMRSMRSKYSATVLQNTSVPMWHL